jgi:ferredoxin--NADP+ reductase
MFLNHARMQAGARRPMAVRAQAVATLTKSAVPLELEKGEMPLNTYSNKAPFKAKVRSVEKIVGLKATGETYHIIIDTEGKIPFWEGQSYGVIPPVCLAVLGAGFALVKWVKFVVH